jgi:hypothetical protein
MTITLTHEEAQQVLDALQCATPPTFSSKLVEEWHKAGDVLRAKFAQPEPVAVCILKTLVGIDKNGIEEWKEELLYTAPPQRKECLRCGEVNPAEIHTCTPQREWVGLTGEELQEIYQGAGTVHFKFAMVEAKLKEKNA